ncbi:MAG: hypothetical protein KAT68_11185 [Bacteroidales bacterium]|nr:hypothetical protein [Bacteroidales bacterium]
MKILKILFLLSTVLISSSIYSQKTVKKYWDYFDTKIKSETQIDGAGRRHGVMKFWSENGLLMYKVHYTNGLENGIQEHYFPGGKIHFYKTYKMGKKVGVQKEYAVDGANYYVKMQRVLDDDEKLAKYYENYGYNKKKSVCDYNGSFIYYYESGKKHITGNYLNRNRVGEWITYYENGSVKYKDTYKKGIFSSRKQYNENNILTLDISRISDTTILVKEYFDNRKIKLEKQKLFRKGCDPIPYGFTGEIKYGKIPNNFYTEYFFKEQIGCYNNYGVVKDYYENGQLMKEVNLASKDYKEYYENGQLAKEQNANEMYIKSWYEDGTEKTIEIISFDENNIMIINYSSFHVNGKQHEKGTYKLNRNERIYIDKWETFYENGNKKSETDYVNNNNRYKTKFEWYQNGNMKYKYIQNSDTTEVEWYETGVLKNLTQISDNHEITYLQLLKEKLLLEKKKVNDRAENYKYEEQINAVELNIDNQKEKIKEKRYYDEAGTLEKIELESNRKDAYNQKNKVLSNKEYDKIFLDINQLKLEIYKLSLHEKYKEACKDQNKKIFKVELAYLIVVYKDNISRLDYPKDIFQKKLQNQMFPNNIIHIADIESGNYISGKISNKKKYIYNSYLLILNNYLTKITSTQDLQQKLNKIKELSTIEEKLIKISSQETKELNKTLKNVSDSNEAKEIILNY